MEKNIFFFDKLIIYFFSIFPISFLLGNTVININIIVIDLSFLIICFYKKKWSWMKDKYFLFILVIWIYLIFNSIAVNISDDSLIRALGFIRYIFLFFAIEYLFANNKKSINKIFYFWSLIICIILVDVVYEKIFGFNILGFESENSERIVSFFKNETIVGGFLFGFSLITTSFLLKYSNGNSNKKLFANLFLILSIICILISNERSNFIKSIIVFFFFIYFVNSYYLLIKKKYIFLILILGILTSTIFFKDVYYNHTVVLKRLGIWDNITFSFISNDDLDYVYGNNEKKWVNRFRQISYVSHYNTAWEIFKDNPIFGVGNKNFRNICTELKYFNIKIKYSSSGCGTHPHQIHFELLSELGIVGYLLIMLFIIYLLINGVKDYIKYNDVILLMSSLVVLVSVLPILPSGSFFSTFNASVLWLNFSILHAFLKKSNYQIKK